VVITEPRAQDIDGILRQTYKLFSDFVSKNPFYIQEQPIKSPLFDARITKEIILLDNVAVAKK
jgi:hypothetical protein